MKISVLLLALSIVVTSAQAAVIDVKGGELYQGEELVNERPTGRSGQVEQGCIA